MKPLDLFRGNNSLAGDAPADGCVPMPVGWGVRRASRRSNRARRLRDSGMLPKTLTRPEKEDVAFDYLLQFVITQ
jgi:hypothetical protein